ncbi:hypothetical protein SAMN05216578_10892 [Halopseudomonas formosensis]|uniref:DUF4149 domain-containing protein n=2 Tax=Pseudomonadaceae TaxID=135621 RepID=A0A1I6BYG6_9GAMM|nr:hypothetical protein SAMN05216578_10892 [Halopseudomonas formosensis]
MMPDAALPAMRSGRVAWQLAQTLWVGGVWMLHFVLLPALEKFGLAPLLVQEIAGFMRPLVVGFAVACVLLQCLLAWVVLRRPVWRDLRGQMLLLVLVAAAGFFLVVPLPRGDYWQLFSYLVIAFAGLVLILQPRPDEEVPRRGEAAQKSL